MKYDLVIFDLDGTVLNTLDDLAGAANHALASYGFPTHSVEEIRGYIGNGVAKLIRRALPAGTDEADFENVLCEFKRYYTEHINDLTQPYPGIPALLKRLRAANVKIGINSNKFDTALQRLCETHYPGLYDYACGESAVTPRKPDPTAAKRIMALANAAPGRTIYIGDSATDLETAKNAGVAAGWVAWGFRRRSEMPELGNLPCFDTPEALAAFLLSE